MALSIPSTPKSLIIKRLNSIEFTPLHSAQTSPRHQDYAPSFLMDDNDGAHFMRPDGNRDDVLQDHLRDDHDDDVLDTLYSASNILSDEDNKIVHHDENADTHGVVVQKKRRRNNRTAVATKVKVEVIRKAPRDTFTSSSDEDVSRQMNSIVRPKKSKEESKASHRMIERKRTRRLNKLMERLKSAVQNNGVKCRKDKASVLESAIDCIEMMKDSLHRVKSELELAYVRERAFFMARGLLPVVQPEENANVEK